jgi:dienelactone hydrolase
MRHTCLFAAALTVTIASAHPGAHAQFTRGEAIPFESFAQSPADVLNGVKSTKLMLAGILRVPKVGQRHPVVVLMHGASPFALGPARGTVDEWTRVLNEAGYATFTVDSFSARGIYTLADAIKLHALTRMPDAFGALEVLAKHPLIDPQRIAVMGFSHGSVTAMYSNLERFKKQFGGTATFAAHISVYGLCGTMYRDDEKLVSPLLMLHGTADNWVPAAPCREYVARLKKAGNAASMIEYPDAHHVFDSPFFAKVTTAPGAVTPAHCRFREMDGSVLANADTGKPLTPADACIIKGPSYGYHEAAAKKAHEDVKAFLADVFQQK